MSLTSSELGFDTCAVPIRYICTSAIYGQAIAGPKTPQLPQHDGQKRTSAPLFRLRNSVEVFDQGEEPGAEASPLTEAACQQYPVKA